MASQICAAPAGHNCLSFNHSRQDSLKMDFDVSEVDITRELPLQHVWNIWEQVVPGRDSHNYSDNTKKIASFTTVQEFWQLWNHVPQPSQLLESQRMVRETDGTVHLVDALMIFKENVKPMWEDPLNACGGHFEYKLGRNVPGLQIDEFWNNLVLGLVGGTVDEEDMITGIRLVDKLNVNRMGSGFIRIEVWYTNHGNVPARTALKAAIEQCMATKLDGTLTQLPHGDQKCHMTHP